MQMRLDLLLFKVIHKIPTAIFVVGILCILASRRSQSFNHLTNPELDNYHTYLELEFTHDKGQSQRTDRVGFVNDQLTRRSKLSDECSTVPFQESIGTLYFEEYQLQTCGSEHNVLLKDLCTSYYKDHRCKEYNVMLFQQLRFKTKDFFSKDKHFTSALVVSDPFTRIAKAFTYLNQSEGYTILALTIMYDYRTVPFDLINARKDLLLHDAQQALAELFNPLNPEDSHPAGIPLNPYLSPLGPTFEEFLLYLLSGHLPEDYLPLSTYCAPCSARFDYILKDTDGPVYLSHFASDNGLPLLHPSSPPSPTILQLFSTLPEELLAFFYNAYQRDCEMFDLPCEKIIEAIREYRKMK